MNLHATAFELNLLLASWTLALVLVAAVSAGVALIAAFVGRSQASVAAAAIAAIAIVAVLVFGQVVSSKTWPAILAAYRAASPDVAQARRQDLANHWLAHWEEIRAVDWYLMSKRWGVCHELWPQSSCTPIPGPREAEGIAREMLTEVARGG